MPIVFQAPNELATEKLGRVLAQRLPPGTVVALIGTLGAGKTRLVQAVAAALDVPAGEVNSPTFVLVQEYQGRMPIYHFDAYRLNDEDEFLELGPEEYFDSAGLTFVEWADRVENCLPAEYLRIEVEVVSESERRFLLSTDSPTLRQLIEQIENDMPA